MATIIQRPDSQCWIACFGRLKRSTKIQVRGKDRDETVENRKRAMAIAEAWEMASCGDQTEAQLRRVIEDTTKRVTKKALRMDSLSDYATHWLSIKRAECEPGTVDFYRATIDRFRLWLGDRSEKFIGDVSTKDVREFLAGRLQRVSPRTANHELKTLKTFFRAALFERAIIENPADFVKPFKEPKALPRRAFTRGEIRAVLDAADAEWRSMVICALYTGQRLADIASLTWSNFDFAANEFTIVTRKTGRTIVAPVPSPLRSHLESLPRSGNALHPRAYKSVAARGRGNALSTQFAKVLARAGLRPHSPHRKLASGRDGRHQRHELSFHSFRNTATTWLHEAGVPPAVVQALIGHDSIDEHQGYIAVGKAALIEASKKLPPL